MRAIQRLAASLPPSNIPHPHLTPNRSLSDSSGIGSPYAHALRLTPGSDDTDEDGTPKKRRGPMRCGKCHQWKKQCHGHCTVRCVSFETCPTQHKRAHPELKEQERELRRLGDDDRKRKRDDDKEDKRREKKVRDEEETSLDMHDLPPPPHHHHHTDVVLDNGERLVDPAAVAASLQAHHQAHHQPV